MRRYFLASLLLAALFGLQSAHVQAAALSIQPLRQAVQLKPGQTVPKILTVTNTSQSVESVSVAASSFNTVDKQYNYEFGAPPDFSSWIQLIEDQAEILPGHQHTFNYNV